MSRPRIAVGGFQHETNTFAPMPTRFEHFEAGGAWPALTEGDALFPTFDGMNIPFAGFVAAVSGFELIPLLWTSAEPGGTVEDACFDRIIGMIQDRLRAAGHLDGVYLDLHGAMTTESHMDAEAEVVARVREVVGPDLPVVISLDLHGNLSPAFFERASAVAIYRTYPHVDMAETGARACRLMETLLERGPFARAFRQGPYMAPITDQSTMREPGHTLYAMLPDLECDGVDSIDFAFAFPPADIRDVAPTIFAYGSDQAAVDRAADRFLQALTEAEGRFSNPLVPAKEAVAEAMALARTASKPVVICDPQDNPGAGAVGDSTGLLRALLDAGATNAALSLFWDPDVAKQAHDAGEGAEIDISLGGRFPDVGGPAVEARATVERLHDGHFPFTGPMYGGATADLGPMALLRVRGVRVVVCSKRCQNADQACFTALGVPTTGQDILVVKSAVHFLADYEPIAERVIFASAPGANPCALATIPYTRVKPGLRLGPNGPAFRP